jgi:hypothetical protein
MEEILANSKALEHIQVTHDPLYNDQVAATEIVKKFIRDRGLIIYGGTAIDYALRLKGSFIYPDTMLAVPDLDFFSPNHVSDSYDLADLLYSHGYQQARAINALHVETQRVDLKDNHWMADISYRPQKIFDLLPVLEYEGMNIIHPDYQRLDLHSSLCFPYDNPPREVVFARWSKDIKRFNLIDQYYPIDDVNVKLPKMVTVTFPHLYTHKCLVNGIAAYAAICTVIKQSGISLPSGVIDLNMYVSNDITFDSIGNEVELVSHNLESAKKYLKLTDIREYYPYINIIPEHVTGLASNTNISIYSCMKRLVTYKSVELSGKKFRIVSVNYLLMYLLAKYLISKSPIYKSLYVSMLSMVKNIKHDILGLSIDVFGSENSSLSKQIAIGMLDHDLKGAPAIEKSTNYKAVNGVAAGKEHPIFKLESMMYYHESGELRE